MKTQLIRCYGFFMILIIFIVTSCSPSGPDASSTEDSRYLTPIPQATIAAYTDSGPITDRMQAVVAASKYLLTTRLWFAEPPAVIFAGELTDKEAAQWVKKTGEFAPAEEPTGTKVWLVVFEGISVVIPPGTSDNATPGPGSLGCTYVILAAGGQSSVTNHAGASCPKSK